MALIILNYIKATFQGKVDASASAELTSAFDKTIKKYVAYRLYTGSIGR